MYNGEKVSAIIVAAGKGERMGGGDKMFIPLGGRPLIAWTLETFEKSPVVDEIVLVLNADNLLAGQQLARKWHFSKVTRSVTGGPERQESVLAGLKTLNDARWVIIHDGARPLVTGEMITGCLGAAAVTGASITAVPVTDTIKLVRDNRVVMTLPRQELYSAQTPQAFLFDVIMDAHSRTGIRATDDASLVEQAGGEVSLYPGSYDNIKITTPKDLELAQTLVRRIGG